VAESGSAEASYYTWVDQFNTSGLGANVPMATGNANESLIAWVDGKWVNMRVPYPRLLGRDGRAIDDPNVGWKAAASDDIRHRTPFHMETAKGPSPRWSSSRLGPICWRGDATSTFGPESSSAASVAREPRPPAGLECLWIDAHRCGTNGMTCVTRRRAVLTRY
jgi:hypothetical protein